MSLIQLSPFKFVNIDTNPKVRNVVKSNAMQLFKNWKYKTYPVPRTKYSIGFSQILKGLFII
jgi:hypothetical protein